MRRCEAMCPAAVVARLAAGQSAWLSELRHVSVLFLRLPDLDDITPSTLRRAHDLVGAVQETLYEYEGSLNKLGVDDKGATLVAAFGLPPVAHEDDPVRAVRAALGIQANLRRLGAPTPSVSPLGGCSAARSAATCAASTR